MAIVRDVLNRVLRTIGEDEIGSSVTTATDKYHLLVLTFLNQIKEEIEDAHDWRVLRQVVTGTVTGGQNSVALTGTTDRARLRRIFDAANGHAVPLVFDRTNAQDPHQLHEMDLAALLYRHSIDDEQVIEPSHFALDVTGDADATRLRVWPTPSVNRTIDVTLIQPQAYLDADDMATNILIPARPLVMGTVWYALMERGEEQGVSAVFTEERFRRALDDAISRDAEEQGGYELIPS